MQHFDSTGVFGTGFISVVQRISYWSKTFSSTQNNTQQKLINNFAHSNSSNIILETKLKLEITKT